MNINDNPYASHLGKAIIGSEIRAMFERACKMRDVVSFAIGEPDFVTPPHIINAAVEKLLAGETHYAPNSGIDPLREAIARKYSKITGKKITAENVIVTSGTMESLLISMQTLLNPGDELLVPTPHFAAYDGHFQIAGIKPVFVTTYEEDEYQLSLEDMEAAITPKTRAILSNTPRNPTGSVFSRKTLEGIIRIAKKHKLAIISDEVYSGIVYDEPHNCILNLMDLDESVILCNSFSKSYAMTGWRIGFTISTPEVAVSLRRIHEYGSSSSNVALQYGATEAIEKGDDDIEAMRVEYQARRDLVCKRINSIDGLSCITPKGAFYIFMNIKGTGLSSREFADRLLDENRVVVVPGTAFGAAGEGYVRLSYATSIGNLIKGMDRMAAFVASLKK